MHMASEHLKHSTYIVSLYRNVDIFPFIPEQNNIEVVTDIDHGALFVISSMYIKGRSTSVYFLIT